ncbi:MAG TPA: hypothetical protein VEA41_04135, partial [Salinarimonas sp.]|nr:hypothetical protein [Salinarimonas sp.]
PWWFWRRVAERTDYHSATDALLARISVAPGNEQRREMDTLIRLLHSSGVWARLDGLHIFAAHTSQAALLNWKANQFNGTLVDAPTFTANRGYQGDGVNDRIDLNYNPNSPPAGNKFTLNDAHMGMWSLTDLPVSTNSNSNDFGAGNSWVGRLGTTAGTATVRSNRGTSTTLAGALPGHVGWNRADASNHSQYAAGVTSGAVAAASTAFHANGFFALSASGTLWGRNQLAAVHWGGSMTANQWRDLYRGLRRYLRYLGAVA